MGPAPAKGGLPERLAPGATPGWATALCGGFLVGEGPRAGDGSCGATASASPRWAPPADGRLPTMAPPSDGRLHGSWGPFPSRSSQRPRPWVPSGLGSRVCVTEAERGTAPAQDCLSPTLRGCSELSGRRFFAHLSRVLGEFQRRRELRQEQCWQQRQQGQWQYEGHRCDRRPPACAGSPCSASEGALCPGAVGEPGVPPGHSVGRWEDPKEGRKLPGMGDGRGGCFSRQRKSTPGPHRGGAWVGTSL